MARNKMLMRINDKLCGIEISPNKVDVYIWTDSASQKLTDKGTNREGWIYGDHEHFWANQTQNAWGWHTTIQKPDGTRSHPVFLNFVSQLFVLTNQGFSDVFINVIAQELFSKVEHLSTLKEISQAIDNYNSLKQQTEYYKKLVTQTSDLKKVKEDLINLQKKITETTPLAQSSKKELWENIQEAFDTLNTRKQQEQKQFEEECEQNYEQFLKEAENLLYLARNSSDTRVCREKLKELQAQLKGKKLKKDQFTGVNNKIQEVFNALNAQREQQEYEQQKNYDFLKPKVEGCARIASITEDIRTCKEELKELQKNINQLKLKKEHREYLFERIQNTFEILNRRQKEKSEAYERECSNNSSTLTRAVSQARNSADYESDFKAIQSKISSTRQTIFNTRPLKQDDKNRLLDDLNKAQEILNSRRNSYQQQKAQEHHRRVHENIRFLEGKIDTIKASILKDEAFLSQLYRNYNNVRPGKRETEIKADIQTKMRDVNQRISSKKQQIEGLYEKIRVERGKL